MSREATEVAAVSVGMVYLAALTWSMSNLSFDIWGAMLLAPIYALLGLAIVRAMFRDPSLRPVVVALSWGLLLKLVGAFARYWVGFEAYGGGIDAGRYHDYARLKADAIWSGDRPWLEAVPTGSGTEFVDDFTAFVYVLTGGSLLGGFVTFSFLAFVGVAFFVKAGVTALPGLASKKFAWLCVLAPSTVYWPSSIGKEAVVLFGLGIGTYGVALLLTLRGWTRAIVLCASGLSFAALIRPHMAGIWLAAALPALVLAVVRGGRSAGGGRVNRFGLILALVLGVACFAAIATFTLRFLEPPGDDGSASITNIIEETSRRTAQAGSNFSPPSISSPVNWPYAVVRTLLRPLPIEARGLAQLISAAEIAALVGLYALSWRRLVRLPRLMLTSPFVLFAVGAVVLSALAFTSFANLGVLTRQKSLLFPFLLMFACLPRGSDGRRSGSQADRHATNDSGRPGLGARAAPERSQSETMPRVAYTPLEIEQFWRDEVR